VSSGSGMASDFASQSPLHVAIAPDGNGWAVARAGVDALRRVVRAAPGLGVGVLTIHALSCDDRRRPGPEVLSILACLRAFLELETPACVQDGVRLTVIGDRERLPAEVARAIEEAERATAGGTRLQLRLALDYSARRAILEALLGAIVAPPGPAGCFGPDVDLLICTGGEQRLGDFLLWESAHAELLFAGTPWSEFGELDLVAAVAELRRRERDLAAQVVGCDSPTPGPCTATAPAVRLDPGNAVPQVSP
jgi:undecaprenyl diphosphate synthase